MIAVFSGTSDGNELIEQLLIKHQVMAFTATKYGGHLMRAHENLSIHTKPLTKDEIQTWIEAHHIKVIVDATHPYATIISQNLIDLSINLELNYYRYERPVSELSDTTVISHESYEDIIHYLIKHDGNILLTTGSNNIELFTNSIKHERIFARVLPTVKVINKCAELGLTPKSIIGMQGPFSKEMNHALMKDLDIKYLVTKLSGQAGGMKEKIEVAKELGIEVHVLKRPNIFYPSEYSNIATIVKAIEEDEQYV